LGTFGFLRNIERLRLPVPCAEPTSPSCVKARLLTLFHGDFRMLMGALVTFLVVILILYLVNLLPIDGRAKQIARVVVIILGVISLLKYIAVF
jgi:hypothetical protein